MEAIRLQKYLAEAGIGSRRKCEEYIEQGKVKVNGNIAALGTKVDPEKDKVEFEEKEINKIEENIYILLNTSFRYSNNAYQ